MWTGESIPIFTDDIHMMGGFADIYIIFIRVTGFDYTDCNGNLSICWSHDRHSGCLKASFEEKTT